MQSFIILHKIYTQGNMPSRLEDGTPKLGGVAVEVAVPLVFAALHVGHLGVELLVPLLHPETLGACLLVADRLLVALKLLCLSLMVVIVLVSQSQRGDRRGGCAGSVGR